MHSCFTPTRSVPRFASVVRSLFNPALFAPVFCTLALLTLGLASRVQAAGLTVVATFTGTGAGTTGAQPSTGVTLDGSGNMFGTTLTGGPGGAGTVWEIAHGTNTIVDLVALNLYDGFFPSTDANGPMGVTLDAAGNLYGTTSDSATSVYGGVYKLPHGSSTLTTTYSFANNPDGRTPTAGVTFDSAGNMYGTTQYGGSAGVGTIWEITAGGTVRSPIASFLDSPGGSEPTAGVTIDSSGNLYGTTAYGGPLEDGTVWELPHGSTTIVTLASFNDSGNGYSPRAGVTLDSSGNLYGTTYAGGLNEAGVVWKIAHGTTTLTVLGQFGGTGTSGDARGLEANGGVTIDGAGNLFGTTLEGGTADGGTIWEIVHGTTSVTTIASFVGTLTAGDPNGIFPYAGVTIDSHGNLFGTSAGGTAQAGIVWELAGVAVPIGGTTLPVPTRLTMTPNPAHPDTTLNGLVTLSQTVTADTPVTITLNGTSIGSVTATAGTNSVSFTVGTLGVLNGTDTFGAALNGVSVTQSVSFTSDPARPVPASLVFTPNPVAPNTTTTALLTLSAPVPTGGLNVALYLNGAYLGYVTFPAGAISVNFGQTLAAGTYTYTAIENGISVTSTLSVTATIPPPTLTSLSPSSAYAGGGSLTLTVNGTGFVSGARVKFGTTSLTTTFVSSTQLTATITSALRAVVGTDTVKVYNPGSVSSNGKTFTLKPRLTGLTLSASRVSGGQSATGTVTLNGPAPTGGVAIPLSSSSTARATVPASVTVAAGATSATFPITALAVTTTGSTTITANGAGGTLTATLTVLAPLTPTADTFGQDGSAADTNYGTTDPLLVKTATSLGTNRDSYLQFSLSGLTTITSAKLQVTAYLSGTGSLTTGVYGTSSAWTESVLTWNNKPTLGSSLGSFKATTTTNTVYTVDVTAYVQSQLSSGTVSFGLHNPSASSLVTRIVSREASTGAAQLIIIGN